MIILLGRSLNRKVLIRSDRISSDQIRLDQIGLDWIGSILFGGLDSKPKSKSFQQEEKGKRRTAILENTHQGDNGICTKKITPSEIQTDRQKQLTDIVAPK